jgi:hypothetical protein
MTWHGEGIKYETVFTMRGGEIVHGAIESAIVTDEFVPINGRIVCFDPLIVIASIEDGGENLIGASCDNCAAAVTDPFDGRGDELIDGDLACCYDCAAALARAGGDGTWRNARRRLV